MFALLVALIALLALLLCVIVLMQAGKGGGLAATFGGASSSQESLMGGRQAATLLTKLTWAGGAIFLFLGLVLSVMSSGSTDQPGSILRGEFQQTPAPPENPRSILETEGMPAEQGGEPADDGSGAPQQDGSGGSGGGGGGS